jgi:hypothetical protein
MEASLTAAQYRAARLPRAHLPSLYFFSSSLPVKERPSCHGDRIAGEVAVGVGHLRLITCNRLPLKT